MNVYGLKLAGFTVFLTGLLAIGMNGVAGGQAGSPASTGSQTVKGDVLNIEEEFYVLKDITGHETRIHVNKDTRMEDRIKVGDKVEAEITNDGHAKSMRVQIPDAAPAGRSSSPATAPNQQPGGFP